MPLLSSRDELLELEQQQQEVRTARKLRSAARVARMAPQMTCNRESRLNRTVSVVVRVLTAFNQCKRVQFKGLLSALAYYAQLEGGASGRPGPNDERRRQNRQQSSLQVMSASVSTLDILPTLAIACLPEALKPEGQAWVADLHKLVRTSPCSRHSLPLRWPHKRTTG